jgi:hypothetical protein
MAASADDCSPSAVQSAFSTVLDQNDVSDAFFAIIGAIGSHFFDTRIRTELSWDGGSRTAFDPPSPAVVVFSREFTSLSECVRGASEPGFVDGYSIDEIPRRVSVVRTLLRSRKSWFCSFRGSVEVAYVQNNQSRPTRG